MHGLEQLYSRFGDSASLVGPVYKGEKETSAELESHSEPAATTSTSIARSTSPLKPGIDEALLSEREPSSEQGLQSHHPAESSQVEAVASSSTTEHAPKLDGNLEKTMQKLTLVPPSMRFGRGKGNRFTAQQRPKAANTVRASLSSLPNNDSASPA